MFVDADVRIDLSAFKQFESQVTTALQNPLGGALQPVFRQWGARYRRYTQKLFLINSRGGGDWKPLKLRTVMGRRGVRKRIKKRTTKLQVDYGLKTVTHKLNRKVRVLKRTKGGKRKLTLKRALNSAKKLFKKGPKTTVKVKIAMLQDTRTLFMALAPVLATGLGAYELGFDGGIRVGLEGGSHPGGTTVSDIAIYHHIGAGNLPVRRIFRDPDSELINDMSNDLRRGIRKLGAETDGDT